LAQPGSSPEDPEQKKAMQGQQGYKQGLPSSRSDTMLLQAAEAQRYGGISSGPQGSAARAAGAAATGSSSQQPRRQAGAGNNIPVFVMLPLDTVSGSARRAGLEWGHDSPLRLACSPTLALLHTPCLPVAPPLPSLLPARR
jgi:hypothetical protein